MSKQTCQLLRGKGMGNAGRQTDSQGIKANTRPTLEHFYIVTGWKMGGEGFLSRCLCLFKNEGDFLWYLNFAFFPKIWAKFRKKVQKV